MEPKCIVTCVNPECGQRLSVPANRGKVKITCVRCKTQWVWSASDDAPSVRELLFRCAVTGKRFKVEFGRQDANHKYRVVHVYAEPVLDAPASSQPSARPLLTRLRETFLPNKTEKPHREKVPALMAPPNSQPSERSLLTKFREFFLSTKSAERATLASTSPVQAFDAKDFDFSGWYCPCCGHSRDAAVYPQFLRCSKCNECVCGARVIRVSPEIQTFECHDGCKHVGRVGGQIETFDGSQTSSSLPAAKPADGPTLKPSVTPQSPRIPNATTEHSDDHPLLGGGS